MKRKHLITGILMLTIIVNFPCCDRDEFSWGTKVGNLVYSGNVIFLGSRELDLIKEISEDGIVFKEKAGEIGKINLGSILVMGVSEKTPYGSLRKVTYNGMNGSEVIVNTSFAKLTEAIKEGTIRIERKLLEKDFSLKSKVDGVLVTGPDKAFDGLAVTLDHLEMLNSGTGSATLEGAVGISADVEVEIEIRFNEIHQISVVTTMNKIDELILNSDGPFNGSNEIQAAEFIHTPLVIDSLVIVPEIAIKCGYQGSVQGEIISGVRQDRIITSQMSYQRSDWYNNPLIHSEEYDFIQPNFTGNADLRIYSGPEIVIRLFGVPVQTVKATGYYELEGNVSGSPEWHLFIGSEGQNTVNADLFGFREDHKFTMEINASEISNSGSK
jgi:hypothetical protein